MKGKEIIQALNNGKRVDILTSRGRVLSAREVAPEGGVNGYDQYGDDRTMGIGEETEYEATVWDYPGDTEEDKSYSPRGRRELIPNRNPRPQRPPRR